MLEKLLTEAINKSVSDIHITSDEFIRIRRRQQIIKLETFLSSEDVLAIAKEVLMERFDSLDSELQLDGSGSLNGVRYRFNVYYEKGKVAIAIRVINSKIVSIDDLRLPEVLKTIIKKPHGLILITGPTGSGKSTTLAAIINEINETSNKHIVTIEDPIEFIFEDKQSIIHQREVGTDTASFSDALRSVLRQDPDIIVIGELRDKETIEIALKASETGHLVISTLHTACAKSTISRISGVFNGDDEERIRYLLSDSLIAIFSQRLFPLADKSGLIGGFEVLINNPAITNLIKNNEVGQIDSYLKMGSNEGSVSMADAIEKHVRSRRVKQEDTI